MSVLIIAEHDQNTLARATLNTIRAATLLQHEITVLVIGADCAKVADTLCYYQGIDKVVLIDHPVYKALLAENLASVISELAANYTHILAPANTFGKNLMPRVAGLLGMGQISDITNIISESIFERPIYAGNAICKLESLDPIKLITVRASAFEEVTVQEKKAQLDVIQKVFENRQSHFIDRQLTKSSRPDLTAARVVISGGRGLQNADNFQLLEKLATQLGAAIGASRAAVDAGFVPNDYQVGQTGKVVAPELYIAIGISGAIQHLAGMKDSKVIVAINKDPDAPIFAIADYGLVGDLFKVLPELELELTKLGYTSP